eukprot:s1376_g4.t1
MTKTYMKQRHVADYRFSKSGSCIATQMAQMGINPLILPTFANFPILVCAPGGLSKAERLAIRSEAA